MNGISILSYVVLILSIGYAFLLPAVTDVPNLLDQKQKYEDSLTAVSNIAAKKQELETSLSQIPEDSRAQIDNILPDKVDFVKTVADIDGVASRYGISISDVSYDEKDESVGNSVETAGPSNPYRTATIGFSFTSAYGSFLNFIRDLESSSKILDVKSVKLETSDKGVNSYSVQIETHWLK